MPRSNAKTPASLPQKPEVWFLAVRPLNIYGDLDESQGGMPVLLLLTDPKNELLVGMEPLDSQPSPETIRDFLFQKMVRPEKTTHFKPHRPQEVQFEQAELAEALAALLVEAGIRTSQAEAPEQIDRVVDELEQMLGGEAEEIPGLLADKSVNPELAAELFAVGAAFFRAAPWQLLSDDQPLAVEFFPDRQKCFIQLMGNAGLQFGLVLYWDWEDLLHVYRFSNDPLEHIPPSGWHAFTFETAEGLPPADLEAVETYGWEVANDEAYPMPSIFFPDSIERPPRQELICYQAMLRAIPTFVERFLQPDDADDFLPAEADFTVDTTDGPMRLKITYPAGDLPEDLGMVALEWAEEIKDALEEGSDGNAQENDPFLDLERRARESRLQEPLQRKIDESPSERAQYLVERAWEASKRSERIRLANQALEVWPDCAEAYLLLADNEAETFEDAYSIYEKGVQAGERALGTDFFKEYEGQVWTQPAARPYLQARQGLAECLASMGREEEALAIYRDLLRLDTADHQDVRYAVLALLLRMARDDEAEDLLDQYQEDESADWSYSRALVEFRTKGDAPQARAALQAALHGNSHVPDYLTGLKAIPEKLPDSYKNGDRSEAVLYVVQHFQNWWGTPGAVDWLKGQPGLKSQPGLKVQPTAKTPARQRPKKSQ